MKIKLLTYDHAYGWKANIPHGLSLLGTCNFRPHCRVIREGRTSRNIPFSCPAKPYTIVPGVPLLTSYISLVLLWLVCPLQ